ncbi:hypothetical protein [Methylobacterium symbioticum]|uniref:hypothetical protein n=1 Tax=Methylobacterium symbioticum TaxID=2584084 RepID=UPI0016240F6C|nr:hypothetical protein [Methylobacterium symbioticum]
MAILVMIGVPQPDAQSSRALSAEGDACSAKESASKQGLRAVPGGSVIGNGLSARIGEGDAGSAIGCGGGRWSDT